jgi:hypothetical protein
VKECFRRGECNTVCPLCNQASAEIGKGIPNSDSKLSKVLDFEESGGMWPWSSLARPALCSTPHVSFISTAELAREKSLGLRPKLVDPESEERLYVMDKGGERFFINPTTYLAAYQHNPKQENPLYITT